MKDKLIHKLGPLLGLLLFIVALWVLHYELRTYHLHDILKHFHELPEKALFSGLLLTVLSYLIMTGYDFLALCYVNRSLPGVNVAMTSFISYAFSNNIGFGMIAGGSIRYRLYSALGLSAFEITKVIGFCALTIWMGFFTVGGIFFLLDPIVLPATVPLPFHSIHGAGIIFLTLITAFIILSLLSSKPLKIRDWEFPLPSPGLLIGQIMVASLDWILAGTVLYVLLAPIPGVSYTGFIGLYLLAQLVALVSQVPGGLGVFETVLIILLSGHLPSSQVLGSLLAYRAIYYICPLLTATLLLGTLEISRRMAPLHRFVRSISNWGSLLIPQILAFTTFFVGAILLFSGSTPAMPGRMAWLKAVIPLPVIEVSHFLGSLAGGCLLILARGLQRRIDASYILSIILLSGGIVFSLFKGLDYEEASILAMTLAVLVPCRSYFKRSASLFKVSFNPGWISGMAAVVICSVWLGFFSYKHVDYSSDLWWHFAYAGNASRYLRATVGVMAILFFYAMARMLSPAPPKPSLTKKEDMDKAEPIVKKHPLTYANLALLGDKSFIFNEKENAFIMYGVEGRSWIAMGDPVGPEEEWPDLIWRFRELCHKYDDWPVFYEITPSHLHLYIELGLTVLKLGEAARVDLKSFSLEGSNRKELRRTLRKLKNDGCTFRVVSQEEVIPLLPRLKEISDAWLEDKNTKEKGFSLGFFNEEYLKYFLAGLVIKEDKIIAFTNLWTGSGKEEMSIDLMRYEPGIPNGVMEYLFLQLMLWGKEEGYNWFDLGMAPLSGFEDRGLAPLWNRAGAYIFRHGEHFYNFQGLRQYKEKFYPQWVPRYIACPGGLAVPRILVNISALTSGGLKGVFLK